MSKCPPGECRDCDAERTWKDPGETVRRSDIDAINAEVDRLRADLARVTAERDAASALRDQALAALKHADLKPEGG